MRATRAINATHQLSYGTLAGVHPEDAEVVIASFEQKAVTRITGVVAALLSKAGQCRNVLTSDAMVDDRPLDDQKRYIVVVGNVRNPRGHRHTETWWGVRYLANVLFVHIDDLCRDPATETAVIAEHLGIEISAEDCAEMAGELLQEQGTGDRTDRLTRKGLATFRTAKTWTLSSACAAYMEHGRRVLW